MEWTQNPQVSALMHFALLRKFPTFAANLQTNEQQDYLFADGRRPPADGRRHDTFVSADYIKK